MKKLAGILTGVLMTSVAFAQQGPPPANVVITKAVEGVAAQSSEAIGTVYFEERSVVASEESGRVIRVAVREGERVKKGALLAELDTELLSRQRDLEEAALRQIEVQMAKTKKNLDRYAMLFENQAASESDFDDLKFGYDELVARKAASETRLKILDIRMDKTRIRAPFDGLVITKNVEVGDWVGPGSPVCVVGNQDALYVQVPVGEDKIRFALEGKTFPVVLNAFGKELEGKGDGFRPQADPKTRNVSLKIKLDWDGPVMENMSATVRVPVASASSVVWVPRDSLIKYQGADLVYSLVEGKAQPLPVEIVNFEGGRAGVRSRALEAGMPVVVEGNERLRPGQPVVIKGER